MSGDLGEVLVVFVYFSTNKSIKICHLQTYISKLEKMVFTTSMYFHKALLVCQ